VIFSKSVSQKLSNGEKEKSREKEKNGKEGKEEGREGEREREKESRARKCISRVDRIPLLLTFSLSALRRATYSHDSTDICRVYTS